MNKIPKFFVNRNPRNLEFLNLKPRDGGWGLERNLALKSFTYKVILNSTAQHTSGSVIHYDNGVVLSVSTRDPGISNQLYSNVDTCAAYNIGCALAQKLLDSGIKSCVMGVEAEELERSSRKKAFFAALEQAGISLQEKSVIPHSVLNDPQLTWQPFSVQHNRQDKLDELFDSQ
ncbi:unnamed protein product [Bursaphelenchus xylophilus]|uniref:(pine wood nematode) hypothetical protein n=1 Tax=Bursaphelenchus xylophilus TaxID=6326 RepID=A0A1I7SF98_BURXY|nr:unnamed protein product [Bursaphelenchus xylophilus]CAG9130448.1 unnamed protein product [Bursaphelenchus xylophilus]